MKKLIILAACLILTSTVAARAYQYNKYSSVTTPIISYSETTKIYDSNGSLQGYNKVLPN